MRHRTTSYISILSCVLLLSGCVKGLPEDVAGNGIKVTASMLDEDTKVNLSMEEGALNLIATWTSKERVVPILNNGRSFTVLGATEMTNISEDGKVGTFNYVPSSSFTYPSTGYQLLCFTENCRPVAVDDEVYYNASLYRSEIEQYQAPMYAKTTVVDGESVNAHFKHYMTYELLHVKNSSGVNVEFNQLGFQSPDGIWYKTRGGICERTGEFDLKSPAAMEPVEESGIVDIAAGGSKIIVSSYIPIAGKKISNATLVAKIDGYDYLTVNTKSSDVELKIGHAYHMYAEWDGKELKFVDAFADAAITVSTFSLEFGKVNVGESKTLSFDITNNTSEQISIGDIWSEDTNFTVDWMAGTIGPKETQTVNVTFTPDRAYSVSGAFTVGNEKESYTVTYTAEGVGADVNAEYVDLGLSVKWATCNLGATKPEEYGLYYQWGDTQGYGSDTSDGKNFYWKDGAGNVTYKWCNGSNDSLTKYNTKSSYGTVDNKTVLEMEDDAARAALGGNWRMPTDAEWTELRENCTWTWTKDYNGTGVAGRIVTSNKSGYTDRSIFLPAAGCRYYDYYLYDAGSYGGYWSSSLNTGYPYYAWSVYFGSDYVYRGCDGRYFGQSVRPVYTETEATPSISVTPTELDFGTVKVGSSATASFTITNTGSTAASVSISAPSAPVTSDVSGNITLNVGASKTVTLTYSPKEKGSAGGSISVVSGGNTTNVRYSGNAEESTGGYSYEYVDLGLSVKWATCNLGATKPEEYGLYYQWGDTQGYSSDTSDDKYFYWKDGAGNVTYKWCNGSNDSLTKYNTDSSYGTVDNKTVLDMEDDAARAALGGNWRMPTDAEWTELRENCTWTWTKDYNGTGVAGRIVTSNKTGYTDKSIFLPAAGYRDRDDLSYAGSFGNYWSSSLYTDYPFSAWYVFFSSGYVRRYFGDRYLGLSVRPVSE